MITLSQGSQVITRVFDLLGTSEDAITAAIGWSMAHAPKLLAEFVRDCVGSSLFVDDARLFFQRSVRRFGRTDLEIVVPGLAHIVLEAKLGWEVPTTAQLGLYASRADFSAFTGTKLLVSLSEADRSYAMRVLPTHVSGVPVRHYSRRDLLPIINRAYTVSRRLHEKCTLTELTSFLDATMSKPTVTSNMVYVVSLSRNPLTKGWPSFVDVVTKHQRYFHPVGPGRGGWPATPPNYLGVRYAGRLQAIYHVESATVTTNLADVNPAVLPPFPVSDPHFLYVLGPAIKPPAPVLNGKKIQRSLRVWAAIDLLLTSPTIMAARDATKARLGP